MAKNREGTKVMEAAPASIVGLGDAAVTSVAAVVTPAPTIIITTAKRAADA